MKRILALCPMLLAVSACAQDPPLDLVSTHQPLVSGSMEVEVVPQSDWGVGYCSNIRVSNQGTAEVTDWSVTLDLDGSTINNLWNGTLSGDVVVPVAHNQTIAAGAFAEFGFCASGSGRVSIASASYEGGGGIGEASCSDGVQNQDETGIDCGGSICEACPVTETCDDGIQNQDETGIDCGGSICEACTSEGTLIPAQIEAEDFVAFYDSTEGHSGDCGSGPVDQQFTSDVGAGCNVGWTSAGEWLEYPIEVADAGDFDITLRLAASTSGKDVQVSIDGSAVGTLTAPANGWQSWEDRTLSAVALGAGAHVVRVTFVDGATNLNWLSFAEADGPMDETCSDGVQNQDESDVDCGGVCNACAATETCDDGIQNQDETGVDCGGVCEACPTSETCDDGVQNQDETGIDCGGVCNSCQVSGSYELPPANAQFDYQIGGAYTPPSGVQVVSRDREASPAPGLYNICYVNGFQIQPGEESWWESNYPDLILRDSSGSPVIDSGWDEMLVDVSTAAKRAQAVAIVGAWVEQCAADGFDAVEIDNLDSYSRSEGLISQSDNIAFMALLADIAHANGLAAAQKNSTEFIDNVAEMGTDFAIAEECNEWNECGDYQDGYGNLVFVIEYDSSAFATGCSSYPELSIVLRDMSVSANGIYDHC